MRVLLWLSFDDVNRSASESDNYCILLNSFYCACPNNNLHELKGEVISY